MYPNTNVPTLGANLKFDELIDDLEGYVGSEPGLYLGTIIFDVSKKSAKKISVVDGQQRLTSLFLLLTACRDRARELQEENMAHATQQVITFTDKITLHSVGMRLIVSPHVQAAFDAIASSEWKGTFPKQISKLQIRRIEPVYKMFRRVLATKDAEELKEFQRTIYQTRVIRINIDSDEEAFSIFERTNDRGLALEVADLLKNYFHQSKVPNVQAIWDTILKNASQAMPKMLRGFFVSRRGPVRKSELYKELRKYGSSVGSDALAAQLEEYSQYFKLTRDWSLTSDQVRNYFDSLGLTAIAGNQDRYLQVYLSLQALRLFNVTQAQPLLFSAMLALRRLCLESDPKSATDFAKLGKALENFHFINTSICSHTGNEVEKAYADLALEFGGVDNFSNQVQKVIKVLAARLAPEDTFKSLFRQISYSGKRIPQIAYIFDRFNNADRALAERKVIYFPDERVFSKNLNIEHIWPQKGVLDKKIWPSEIDNVGNLLVVSKQMNSALGNASVEEKVSQLQTKFADRVGEFPTIGQFLKLYKKMSHEAEQKSDADWRWSDEGIAARAQSMAEVGYRVVWKI